jgi:hypothetical protein
VHNTTIQISVKGVYFHAEELKLKLYKYLKSKLKNNDYLWPGLFVSMGVRGKPRMYLSLAGFLYSPLWTFQLWPQDAPAPTDAFRTLAAEVRTYGRGMRTGNFA